MIITYLGPKGTFSEEAAKNLSKKIGLENIIVPVKSFETAIKTVTGKDDLKADATILGVYNCMDGLIHRNVDALYENNLRILAATRVSVNFAIGCYPGKKEENHRKIFSFDVALAQCSNYLSENYSLAEKIRVDSTMDAVERVKDTKSGLAIAKPESMTELEIIATRIENKKGKIKNFTEFYLVSSNGKQYECEYRTDKEYNTLVAITPHIDREGLLAEILTQISYHKINNSKVHSRPALDDVYWGEGIEPQMFYLEMIVHKNDPRFIRCMESLQWKLIPKGKDAEVVRVLGTYERPKLIE